MSTELFQAIVRGSVEEVERILGSGGDANAVLRGNWTHVWTLRRGDLAQVPLEHRQAAEHRVLEEVLHGGIDRDSQTYRTRTPLLLAAEFGETAIVEVLLAHGAEVNYTDEDGWTGVLFAVRRSAGDLLRVLLQAGADPNPLLTGGLSALFLAARAGFPEGVRRLLEAGADVNSATVNGLTPLMAAASFGQIFVGSGPFYAAERFLVEEALTQILGRDTRFKPQHLACLEMLLDAGADPNKVGYGNPINDGDTALKLSALTGVFTASHLLMNAGAEINFSGGILATAFMCAVCSGKEPTVAYFKERGADIFKTSADGLSALMCAARSGFTHLVHYLLDNGVSVNERREDGETALFFAVNGGHVETARALLERGAQVDATDVQGRTALMLASYHTDPDMVQLLLNEGADVNLRSKDGRTALGWVRAGTWDADDEDGDDDDSLLNINLMQLDPTRDTEETLETMRQMLGEITGETPLTFPTAGSQEENRLRVQRMLRFAGGLP